MTTQCIAELELEVVRLREALEIASGFIRRTNDEYGVDSDESEIEQCVQSTLSTPFTPTALTTQVAALELEVARLRSVMADVIKAHGYAGGTPVEVLSTPFTPTALTTQVAELELEVVRLREVIFDMAGEEPGISWGKADKVLSTPFTPTALSAMITKASEVMRQRAISAGSAINPIYGAGAAIDAIRALPNVMLEELL